MAKKKAPVFSLKYDKNGKPLFVGDRFMYFPPGVMFAFGIVTMEEKLTDTGVEQVFNVPDNCVKLAPAGPDPDSN